MNTLARLSEERNKKPHQLESLKEDFDFAALLERIEEYAKTGYDSISDDDKKFLLKSLGIFDRPSTPKLFMMRIRIPAGKLSLLQAEVVARCAAKGNGVIDITTRMQVEIRGVAVESVPSILKELEACGLSTRQTGVDNFRNIVADPLSGSAFDSVIDTTPIVKSLNDFIVKNEEWMLALPRKFNIGISGSFANRCNVFGQDAAFVLANKDGEYGFNLYVGGKVGVLAKDADVFVSPDEVLGVFGALAGLFRDYGFRDNRNKNRLSYLVEAIGMQEFRASLEEFYGKPLSAAGANLTQAGGGDTAGQVPLRDGLFALHVPIPVGRTDAKALLRIVESAEKFGARELALTVEQNIYCIGMQKERSIELKKELSSAGNINFGVYSTHLLACAGSLDCPFGVIENKQDALRLAEYLQKEVPLSEGKIRFYFSGCPKGCGIHGAGDLGFLGTKAVRNQKAQLAVDVFFGGQVGLDAVEAKLLCKAVFLDELNEYVAELVKLYAKERKKNESFESYLGRLDTLFSKYLIDFVLWYNRFTGRIDEKAKLCFSDIKPTAKGDESSQVASVGLACAAILLKNRPYGFVHPWELDGQKYVHFGKEDFVNEGLGLLTECLRQMLHPDRKTRAQSFSELLGFVRR